MKNYKVDWLAFSVRLEGEEIEKDTTLIEKLGYDLSDFEEVPGKFFYNSGATLANMVSIYWNDPDRPTHRNSSRTMTVVFTGQGSTDLAKKIDNKWQWLFTFLEDYGGVKITRLDLAFDDYDETVKLSDIEKKLEKGHYRSSKKSYNVVKTSDVNGKTLGETIYIGNARSNNGSRGNYYARFYDKKAQSESKNVLFPTEVREHWQKIGKESWQRYEISYSKTYARQIATEFIQGKSIDEIFKTSLRGILEILTPKKGEKNKSRWHKTKWWENFLAFDEALDFRTSDPDPMLGDVLEWLRVAVLPTLGLLEEIGEESELFDIYDLLRQAKKPAPDERSKKQNRLLMDSKKLSDDMIRFYLDRLVKGGLLDE